MKQKILMVKKEHLHEENSKDIDWDLVRQFTESLEDLKAGRVKRVA